MFNSLLLLYTTETGDASPSRDDLTINSFSPYMIAPNAYLTPAQEDKVEEIVQAINSDIPIHVTIMCKSHVNREKCKLVSTRNITALVRLNLFNY
jgi:hypothetical protein